MARQFAKAELAPVAKEIDDEGRFPWEVVEKMGPLNFFGMQAPRKYGGAEMDSISLLPVASVHGGVRDEQ